jgi:hypothetical protein
MEMMGRKYIKKMLMIMLYEIPSLERNHFNLSILQMENTLYM